MKKVTCPIFDGHDYPMWKAMRKNCLMAMNIELWTVTKIGVTDLCKKAEADEIHKYTRLDIMAKDIICSCLSCSHASCALCMFHFIMMTMLLSCYACT